MHTAEPSSRFRTELHAIAACLRGVEDCHECSGLDVVTWEAASHQEHAALGSQNALIPEQTRGWARVLPQDKGLCAAGHTGRCLAAWRLWLVLRLTARVIARPTELATWLRPVWTVVGIDERGQEWWLLSLVPHNDVTSRLLTTAPGGMQQVSNR